MKIETATEDDHRGDNPVLPEDVRAEIERLELRAPLGKKIRAVQSHRTVITSSEHQVQDSKE